MKLRKLEKRLYIRIARFVYHVMLVVVNTMMFAMDYMQLFV